MAGERQVSVDELDEFTDARNSESMHHDANFDRLFAPGELIKALYRLIESSTGLHYIVMLDGSVRIEWDT
jgi:hypothetical protein